MVEISLTTRWLKAGHFEVRGLAPGLIACKCKISLGSVFEQRIQPMSDDGNGSKEKRPGWCDWLNCALKFSVMHICGQVFEPCVLLGKGSQWVQGCSKPSGLLILLHTSCLMSKTLTTYTSSALQKHCSMDKGSSFLFNISFLSPLCLLEESCKFKQTPVLLSKINQFHSEDLLHTGHSLRPVKPVHFSSKSSNHMWPFVKIFT